MPTECPMGRQRASVYCPHQCEYRSETLQGVRCLLPSKQRGKAAHVLESTDRCCHPRCRLPSISVISENPDTRLAEPGYPEKGYCERHEAERLEAARRIFEERHREEIEANKERMRSGQA